MSCFNLSDVALNVADASPKWWHYLSSPFNEVKFHGDGWALKVPLAFSPTDFEQVRSSPLLKAQSNVVTWNGISTSPPSHG